MVSTVLAKASESRRLERLVARSRPARAVAMRFVAGERLEDGLDAASALAERGRSTSLDFVGERVVTEEDAREAAAMYHRALDGIDARGLPAGISVKPTQLGLLAWPARCAELVDGIATRAGEVGAHVTLDMEDSGTTEATVQLVEACHRAGHHHVGCALQTYLRRTEADVVRLEGIGASLRLCKGAYAEPAHLAYQSRRETDASYRRCATRLLAHGTYPRFATHDDALITHVLDEAARLGRSADSFEFQMLYGVRAELQARLVDEGFRVCVYVPFGQRWYAYFMRRLAERPANVLFLARALRGQVSRRADRGARTVPSLPVDARSGPRPPETVPDPAGTEEVDR
ncbi:proline dehydrogenase [Egibacter rhizosphaerae]|uniref:proline dehydrogenase n=1 Tax=Egibacter rhizosphaerae TaxID=1670831 RepID=A0A411YIR7_9ACTN|nr:proline dehydrogenase family protein [Egibacter rhizosphaerae]QBI20976.1 proline dehydrogenase [Egibacter rhizosphaerae]